MNTAGLGAQEGRLPPQLRHSPKGPQENVQVGGFHPCRYKQQLSLAVEREQSLERDKVQLELDWQRRCEGVEREQYRRAEDLIQGLTAARDQVSAPQGCLTSFCRRKGWERPLRCMEPGLGSHRVILCI